MDIEVGKLKHRIEVWGKEKIINEYKETDYTDKKIKTIWAEVVPQTGALQKQQADTILSNTTHKIKCRYSAGHDIKQDNWIIFSGRRFDIKYILDPYFKHVILEIFVEEIQG